MPGFVHSPRIADVERSVPGIAQAAEAAGLGAELRALVEMLDRRDRDIEQRHLNPPSCRLYANIDTPMPAATPLTYLPFTTVRYDSTGGAMWKATDATKIVAPFDGVYSVGANAYVAGAHWGLAVYATAWGAQYYYAVDEHFAPGYAVVNTEVAMRAGDFVQISLPNATGVPTAAQTFRAVASEAWVTWLRPGVVVA